MSMNSRFELFKALGDRTRYNIILSLLGGERCACELPALVKRAQPTVSLQLKYLIKAGLLSSRRDGKNVLYRLKSQDIAQIMGVLGVRKSKSRKKC